MTLPSSGNRRPAPRRLRSVACARSSSGRLVNCSIQAGRALEGARHVTEYPSMLGPNPFLVPASYPSPFGTPLHPLHSPELSLPAQAANARKDIQDWRKSTIEAQIRYAADMFSAQRPNALRDDMQSTSATDATGPPICDSGCPRQAYSRRDDAKRKRL